MPRFRFYAEVDCAMDVLIEAPDATAAWQGARLAMIEHVAEEGCNGVRAHEVESFEDEPVALYSYTGQPGDPLMSRSLEED